MSRQKKKILLVGSYSFDGSESMNRYVTLLEQSLRERGHDVRLVSPPRVAGRLGRQGSGVGKWLGYVDKFALFPWQLIAASRSADIVHICDQGNASYARILPGRRLVITCHDMFAIRAGLGAMPGHVLKISGKALQAANRSGLERADAVICISDHTREEVLRYTACDPERVKAADLPLNYPYAPASAEQVAAARSKAGIGAGQGYFFHIGGNFPYKNRPGVVRIFSELRGMEAFRTTKLILAGAAWSPDLREEVTTLGLSEVVREVETPTNEELRALYSGATALIFPSLYEGFGWPLVEAQACGCPVAASNRRPLSDILRDSGILFDPLDPIAAARLIAEGLTDPAGLRTRGFANARRFTVQAMIDIVEAAYV